LLLLGVTYKRDVADIRESPALAIMNILRQKEALVTYHDPYMPSLESGGRKIESQHLDSGLLSSQDCVIVTTDHSCFDYQLITEYASLLFDTRNATHFVNGNHSHVHLL
jgi:UDP-N-acetyl-D-glucosamine dehydrogenase